LNLVNRNSRRRTVPVQGVETTPVWPLAVYFAAVVFVVAGMVVASWLLGQRHNERATGQPYESGLIPTGSARMRFANEFHLIAMFFVVIDLEAVFIFAWAVAARELGWAGYVEVLVFIAVLAAALIYLAREGALDWGTTAYLKRRAKQEARRRSDGDIRAQEPEASRRG
jgi:NADH-quinone oxidoreductase subunit A